MLNGNFHEEDDEDECCAEDDQDSKNLAKEREEYLAEVKKFED